MAGVNGMRSKVKAMGRAGHLRIKVEPEDAPVKIDMMTYLTKCFSWQTGGRGLVGP